MAAPLRGRSLLTLRDFDPAEVALLLDTAAELKAEKRRGISPRRLAHKNLALIFLKPSMRTRAAFAVAAADEGAHLEVLQPEEIRFGVKESVRDIARVLGRLFDGIVFRGFDHQLARQLAEWSGVPVWNALTDTYHPTQALADLLTLREVFGRLAGLRVAYVGDGRNNVATSLMIGAARTGLDLRVVTPPELAPPAELVTALRKEAVPAGRIEVGDLAAGLLEGCQAIYNDVWVSMGEEDQLAERVRLLAPYKATTALMDRTGREDAIYLHCLPALHDLSTEYARAHPEICEVDDEVFESPRSRVFEQAENRMHTAKAVMVLTL